jgi:hypothetical protein
MTRAVVQELKCQGHCLPYALDIATALATSIDEVHLVLNGQLREKYKTVLGCKGLPGRVSVHWIDGIDAPWNLSRTARLEVETGRRLIEEHRPDRIVLPTADTIIQRLFPDLSSRRVISQSGLDWDLIIHGIPAGTPGIFGARLHKWAGHRLALDWVATANLLSPDPYVTLGPGRRWLARRSRRSLSFLPYVLPELPDLSREEARTALQVPTEGRLLVVPGVIDPRKAMGRLLEALPSLSGVVDGVLLAGPLAKELREAVTKAVGSGGPTLHLIDRFLDAHLFGCSVLAADLVWAVYPRWRGISSMQWLAGKNDRRCLIDTNHLSGRFVSQKGVGCFTIGDSVSRSVREALESPGPDDAYKGFLSMVSNQAAQRAVLCDGVRIDSLAGLDRIVANS